MIHLLSTSIMNANRATHSSEPPGDTPLHGEPVPEVSPDASNVWLLGEEKQRLVADMEKNLMLCSWNRLEFCTHTPHTQVQVPVWNDEDYTRLTHHCMKALLLEDWLQWSALVGDLLRFVPLATNLCHPQLGPCNLEVGGVEGELDGGLPCRGLVWADDSLGMRRRKWWRRKKEKEEGEGGRGGRGGGGRG